MSDLESHVALFGIKLDSRNLLNSNGLQVQLMQILQLLAEYGLQFKEHDKRIDENHSQIRELNAQLKAARGEIARVDDKVDALDKALRAGLREVDERHTRNHEANSARIDVLELEKDSVREEIEALKPRISTLEQDTHELQRTVGEHGVRLTTNEGLMENTRERMATLEKTIEEADLAGIKVKLDLTADRCSVLEEKQDKMAIFLDKTNKKVSWLENTIIPEVRKEAKDDRAKIRSEVDGHVMKLMSYIKNNVTRQEFEDTQNFFHVQMTNWVVGEIDESRRSMLEKINRVQTRMAQELEDLTNLAGVEDCVAKVQEITSAVGQMSESLYEHKEAIERNADKLLQMGANSAQVAEIREGFEDLKKKTHSALMMIKSKVQKQLDSQPQGAQALENLNNQVALSIEEIHTKLESVFAPRMTFEETIEVLKKRIIDLEWKMMRRKADDIGILEQEMYRDFNDRLKSLNYPIILAQKHPAVENRPPRPRSALPAGGSMSSSSKKHRPGSAQIRTVREVEDTEQGPPTVAVSYFESPEMRQAFREGRNTNVKGSSAAMRIYRPRNAEYGLEIPASIQAMMAKHEQNDLPIDHHLDHLSFNDPVFQNAYPPQSTSSQSQWTNEHDTLSGEYASDRANSGRPASAHASLRTSGLQQQSSRVSLAGHHPASTKPHARPGTAPARRATTDVPDAPEYMIHPGPRNAGDNDDALGSSRQRRLSASRDGTDRSLHPLPEALHASQEVESIPQD